MSKPLPIDRREVLAGLAAGAGIAAVAGLSAPAFTQADPPAATAGQVEELFCELAPGRKLDGRTVATAHPVHLGAVPVVLEIGAERFQVDVLRRDEGGPQPVAQTRSLALFIANRGDGSRDTVEEHGLAAMTLAAYLDAREAAGVPVPELLSLSERAVRHAHGVYCVV